MPQQTSGYGPPKVEGYSIEPAPARAVAPSAEGVAAEAEEAAARAAARRRLKLTLRGEGFITRAMPLVVAIGDVMVTDYSISPDGRTVVCFLDELPEEGATITVGYTRYDMTELPERFSRSKLAEEGPNA